MKRIRRLLSSQRRYQISFFGFGSLVGLGVNIVYWTRYIWHQKSFLTWSISVFLQVFLYITLHSLYFSCLVSFLLNMAFTNIPISKKLSLMVPHILQIDPLVLFNSVWFRCQICVNGTRDCLIHVFLVDLLPRLDVQMRPYIPSIANFSAWRCITPPYSCYVLLLILSRRHSHIHHVPNAITIDTIAILAVPCCATRHCVLSSRRIVVTSLGVF